MRHRDGQFRSCEALTILEMVIALSIITVIFAAVLPQFRLIYNSWDSKRGNAEVLQNGRVLIDHITRNLSAAERITAVSNSDQNDGFIEFEDNDGNNLRYDISAGNYVEFGPDGNLSDLAGPVSLLRFTCYDDNDFVSSTTDVNSIRFVSVQATFPSPASLGQEQTFTASVYLRTGQSSPCSTGLVGWWKLDETGGTTAADSSGNGNNGTLVNMDPATDWVGGRIGGALEFDGYNDYVDCGNNESLDITGAITLAVWVKTNDAGNSQYNYFVGKGDTSYAIQHQSSNQIEFFIYDSSSWYNTWYPINTSFNGTWHHLAGTYDGSILRLYVDGIEQDTKAHIGSIESTAYNVYIGENSQEHNCYYNGDIDDVRIYDRALDANEIVQLMGVTYQQFTEAKADSDTTSITIPTPGGSGSGTVAILGSWTSGLTHTAEAGSNRLLILTAHVEDNDYDMSLNSVTYGGESMTKVIESQTNESGLRAYVVAYILDEAGIDAASGNTFDPSWSSRPDSVEYSSVFVESVNQTTPVGASDSSGSNTASTISTSALSTNDGDMVIVAATAGYTGTYSVNNGFTEAIELSITSADGVAGYKAADGSSETPSVTHSNPYRQVIIGFVVQVSGGGESDTIEGDLLIAAVATDGDTSFSLTPPAGEGWTEIDIDDYSSEVTLGAWWKLADASESSSHEFTWSGDEQAYGWMMRFTGHDPNDPINDWWAGGESSSTPTSPAVTTTVDNCLILRLGAFDGDDITVDNPGLSGHTAITMDESASGGGSGVTAGLMGYWNLDETGGTTAADSSGNGNTGTLQGTPLPTWAPGQVGNCLSFASGGGRVYVPSSSTIDFADEDFSVALWAIQPTSWSGQYELLIKGTMGVGAYPGTGKRYELYRKDAQFRFCVDDDVTKSELALAVSDFCTGSWVHIVALRDTAANQLRLYANGVLKGTATDSTGSISQNEPLYIADLEDLFTGAIDDVRIYDRALEPEEITALYQWSGGNSGTVSGGAGYVKQSSAGDSGTSTFTLNSSNEAQMLTIAIAPDQSSTVCDDSIRP